MALWTPWWWTCERKYFYAAQASGSRRLMTVEKSAVAGRVYRYNDNIVVRPLPSLTAPSRLVRSFGLRKKNTPNTVFLSECPHRRPFGVSCGSPKAIGKLYPVALIEMARVLRPGSGRAVLLVAQPYLLGLPEIRRERRKPGGSEAAKGRRRGGACKHYVSSSASPREELRRHENDEHRDAATAAGGGSDFLARGGHEEEQIGSEDFCNQASANVGKDVVAVEKIPSSGAPGALWRVRERHAVNVGGLVSCLVLLDRTNEPSPRPCSDRRRRWVGLHGYCKRRNQQLSTAGVVL